MRLDQWLYPTYHLLGWGAEFFYHLYYSYRLATYTIATLVLTTALLITTRVPQVLFSYAIRTFMALMFVHYGRSLSLWLPNAIGASHYLVRRVVGSKHLYVVLLGGGSLLPTSVLLPSVVALFVLEHGLSYLRPEWFEEPSNPAEMF